MWSTWLSFLFYIWYSQYQKHLFKLKGNIKLWGLSEWLWWALDSTRFWAVHFFHFSGPLTCLLSEFFGFWVTGQLQHGISGRTDFICAPEIEGLVVKKTRPQIGNYQKASKQWGLGCQIIPTKKADLISAYFRSIALFKLLWSIHISNEI